MELEQITIGQIATAVIWLVAFVAATASLFAYAKRLFSKGLKQGIAPLEKKIDGLQEGIDQTQKDAAKNYMTKFLATVDKGESYTQIEFECYCSNRKIYFGKGGNDFIHAWENRLQKEGKLPKFMS